MSTMLTERRERTDPTDPRPRDKRSAAAGQPCRGGDHARTGSGTVAREAATGRAVLRMSPSAVPAAQAARFGRAGDWLGRLLSAFAE